MDQPFPAPVAQKSHGCETVAWRDLGVTRFRDVRSVQAIPLMPRWSKYLLLAACSALLIAVGGAFAYKLWWQTRGAEIVASLGDGTRFGTGKDRQACVGEAVLRVKQAGSLTGFTEQVKNELFLEECLKAAAPVDGFCAGVPAKSDTATSIAWRTKTSGQYGLEGTLRQGLVREIQDFCEADAGSH
jgi:hypothetical protein